MRHTPAPWRADAEGLKFEIVGDIRSDCQGETVVGVATVHGNETSRIVSLANARVLAAAPELLAACLPVLEDAAEREDYMHDTWNPDAHVEITLTIAEIRAVRAAVDKARLECLYPMGCDCAACIEKYGPIHPKNVGQDIHLRPRHLPGKTRLA